MEYIIGGQETKLTSKQKAERLKKAVKIVVCSSHHRKEILKDLSKEEKSEADTLLQALSQKCEEDITFEALEQHLNVSKKLYKALKAEVAEIASSSDKMLGIGETTSWLSQLLSPIPCNVGAMVHSGIRGFFKFFACKNMGDKKFKNNPDLKGSLFFKPKKIEDIPDGTPEDAPKPVPEPPEPKPVPEPPEPKPASQAEKDLKLALELQQKEARKQQVQKQQEAEDLKLALELEEAGEPSPEPPKELAPHSKQRGHKVKEVAVNSLYKRLHDGVRTGITNFRKQHTHQYDFDAIEKALKRKSDKKDKSDEEDKSHKEAFKDFASDQDKNFLSRYVAALDRADHSRHYEVIDIHHAALLKASENNPDNKELKEAANYLTAAVAVNTAYSADDRELKEQSRNCFDREAEGIKDYIPQPYYSLMRGYLVEAAMSEEKYDDDKIKEEIKNSIADFKNISLETISSEHISALCNAFRSVNDRAKVEAIKPYRKILDDYGSATFLVREGEKGAQGFTHFGSVIVENNKDKTGYHVRIENPEETHSIIYPIKRDKVNETLRQLLKVHMNGNPFKNLGKKRTGEKVSVSEVAKEIISLENLGERKKSDPQERKKSDPQERKKTDPLARKEQDGNQCGIHSSRRIIPKELYHAAGLQDCDILGLVEPAAVPLAITEK